MTHQLKNNKRRYLVKGSDRYDKISYRDKIMLLKRVIIDEEQIKETSQKININYSTAKTFLRKFKSKATSINRDFINSVSEWFKKHDEINQRCGYKQISSKDSNDGSREPQMAKQVGSSTQNTQGSQVEVSYINRACQITIYHQVLFG